MRDTFGNIGISIATNTALFTGLDLGQRIADTLSLWTLPANLIAAVIATVFGLTLTAATRVLRSTKNRQTGGCEIRGVRYALAVRRLRRDQKVDKIGCRKTNVLPLSALAGTKMPISTRISPGTV